MITKPSNSLSYRPELDGLRAIAVVLVLFYHAEFILFERDWFQAGFLGVDVFFVISGYIISRIILSDLRQEKFQFSQFYLRRVKRILPALFFVMAASFPFAWMYLLPLDFVEYAKSILSSIFFGSNFFFYSATTVYGADSSLLKPFLHTWSLSVEEQFYIVFPLLLFIGYQFPQWLVKAIVLIGILLSLKAANVFYYNYPDLNFYLLPTRSWELLVGVFLALNESHVQKNNNVIYKILPSVGALLILYSLYLFSSKIPHPSFYTAIPVLGIALIIFFSSRSEIIGKVLSMKFFTSIGLISYSLYLWHFPIFAFARIQNEGLGNIEKFICILIAVILSVFSYKWIETPFRRSNKINFKSSMVVISSLFAVLVVANVFVVQKDGFNSRLPEFFTRSQSSQLAWDLLKDSDGQACHNKTDSFCFTKNDELPRKIMIIGDSHISTLQFDLFERLKARFNMLAMTVDACWFANDFALAGKFGNLSVDGCSLALQEKRFEELKSAENAIVIIGGRLPLYLSNEHFDNQEGGVEAGDWTRSIKHAKEQKTLSNGIKETIYDVLALGHDVILVYPLVESGWHVPKKIFANMSKSNAIVNNAELLSVGSTSYSVYNTRTQESFNLLDSIQHGNLHRVYPHKVFCDSLLKGRCVTHDLTFLYYTDDDHPSPKGAELINNLIIDKVNEITNK